MPDPTLHQSFQPFPNLDAQFVEQEGNLAPAAAQLLISLWLKSGGKFSQVPNGVFIQQNPTTAGAPLTAYDVVTGATIGVLALANASGPPPEIQTPVVSPFIFTTTKVGTLVVFSGKVEIRRTPSLVWHNVSLVGGPVPMLVNDIIRVSWFNLDPPEIVFFPSG